MRPRRSGTRSPWLTRHADSAAALPTYRQQANQWHTLCLFGTAPQVLSLPMPLTASQLVLQAKQLEIEAVQLMASRVELADLIGQLIHALQRERGASSIFLASGGQQPGCGARGRQGRSHLP